MGIYFLGGMRPCLKELLEEYCMIIADKGHIKHTGITIYTSDIFVTFIALQPSKSLEKSQN